MLKQFAKAGVAGLALAGFIATAQATGGSGDGSWNGVYVGGHAGGGWADADVTLDQVIFGNPSFTATNKASFDLEGWLAGGHIGVNVQHGAFVIGGELSLSAAEIDGSKSGECPVNSFVTFRGSNIIDEYSCKKHDEWLLLGMTRFGYAPGSWMGYVTLGVAVTGAQTSHNETASRNGIPAVTDVPGSAGSSTDLGFAIGGGAEFRLGHGLIAGVEYIHADFDDMRDGANTTVFSYEQDIDIVRARLSLMLDRCCGEAGAAPSKSALASGYAGILPATGSTWSGVYFGGHVGGGWADVDVSADTLSPQASIGRQTGQDSLDLDGWLAGVHFGAMVQRGDFVFGTELSLSGAEIDGSKSQDCFGAFGSAVGFLTDDTNLGCRKEDEWLLLAMSRIGYAPSNWMAYVTYGLAIVGAQTDVTANSADDGFFGIPFTSDVNNDVGFAIGGGAEIKLGSGIIAGVEYIHADFDDMRNGQFFVFDWDQDMDIVRARLSMMLNDCCDAPAAPTKTNMASPGAAAGWGGLYFGSHVGYGWADADVTAAFLDESFRDSFDLEGWLAGGHIGGNVQRGALVVGGELSLSAAEIDGSKTQNCLPGFDFQDDPFDCKKEDEWLALAMARLGYAPGSWMAYVTAGAAIVGVQTDLSENGAPETAGSDTDLGYAVGGGVELQLGHGLIAGVEYIHAGFDGMEDGGAFTVLTWDQDDMDIVRARISVKLGGCCAAAPAHVPLK